MFFCIITALVNGNRSPEENYAADADPFGEKLNRPILLKGSAQHFDLPAVVRTQLPPFISFCTSHNECTLHMLTWAGITKKTAMKQHIFEKCHPSE